MDDQKQKNENQNQNNINQTIVADEKDMTEEYLNNWKRERADFVNYKKDEAKRMEEFVKFANAGLILELLDTMDDLYMATKQVKDAGLGQVIKKFEDLLKKYGVEKIEVGGPSTGSGQVKFDPMLHEVVSMEEGDPVKSPDGDNGARNIEEVRVGYTMNGRVIRPARVKIIK
ncbi:MAG: nucleotide exchange factor GrpE [Candidatus Yanofskybacteria bacterium]|nr:nucleotide exchange factor GrpE [Candidatus Yanofskybacteria bacterium]